MLIFFQLVMLLLLAMATDIATTTELVCAMLDKLPMLLTVTAFQDMKDTPIAVR